MELKAFSVKAIGGEGKLSGRASPFGDPADSYGDVIAPFAYDKWIARTGGVVLVTSNHDLTKTIGKGIARIGVGGLDVDITLSMELQDAKDAFIRARDGLAQQLSIGYETVKSSFRRDGVRVLEEINLFEIGMVPLGAAGDRAQLSSIKAQQAEAAGIAVLSALSSINSQMKRGRVFSASNEGMLRDVHAEIEAVREKVLALLAQLDETA